MSDVFYALSFVLSGRFGDLYGRTGDSVHLYTGDSRIIPESWHR